MANLNNPAGRLLHWLELGNARPRGNSAMAEWCTVFGLDHSLVQDRGECSRRGMLLIKLARDVRREAEQLPEAFHPEVLLAHFERVESTLDHFTVLPSVTIEAMFASMSGEAWMGLTVLDAMLSTHRPEQVVAATDLREHIDSVRALIDEIVADADLEEDLRRYVVARLRDIEDALNDALITGVAGLELAVNATFGARRREPDWWDRIARTKWAPRIAGVWFVLVTTLGSAGGLPALLPSGDGPPAVEQQPVQVDVDVDLDEVHDAELVDDDEP